MTTDAAALSPRSDAFFEAEPPIVAAGRRWTAWAGVAISCAMLAAIAFELRRRGLDSFHQIAPLGPASWIVLLISYCVTPASEWVIFRRLWPIPAEGFLALMRKRVSNELLLGYLGEVQFYAWVRRRAHLTAAPFGAIKDVAILSAIAGNAATLLMAAAALPLLLALHLGLSHAALGGSVAALLLLTALPLLFRRRLFSLPADERRFVLIVHIVRIVANILLAALLWHMLLPAVAMSWWFLLATVRQLLSRLPLLPNKDLLFAGVAAFLVGRDIEVAGVMAMIASITLLMHLAVGGVLAAFDVARP